MLGPIGSNVMKMLRILTPDSIERLTKLADGRNKKISGAAGATVENSTSKAVVRQQSAHHEEQEQEHQREGSPKVIPIHSKNKEEFIEEEVTARAAGSSYISSRPKFSKKSNSNALESIGVLSNEELAQIEQENEQNKKNKEPSSTVFLIEERKRLNEANSKIYCQLALKNYKSSSSSSLDMAVEEQVDKEPQSNSTTGILLNKKQF